ncbi:MAG: hypothetical protein M3P11_12415 [Actinomycetota bacterium]|nr:hypothetical protein [Actinomycetota bacterium]
MRRRIGGEFGDATWSLAGHGDLVNLLGKVEADLAARRTSGALEHALTRWQTRHEELTGFADPGGLIAFIREPDVERRESKDKALAALCVEGTGGDDEATLLLVWLMLPGLLLLRRRLMVRDGLDRDDLDAELLTGVWEAATRVGPETPYVAARLLDGARRRVLAAIRREEDWTKRTEPLQRDGEGSVMTTVDEEGAHDVLAEGVGAGVISTGEAELLRASRVVMPTLRSRLGISESAARSRRLRAKRRLLAWLATSSGVRPTLPGSPQGIPTGSTAPRATDGPPQRPL